MDAAKQKPIPSETHLVLIPSYNTGDTVLKTVHEAFDNWAPVWVVVDGSDDGSGDALEALAETEPDLRVFRLARNQGKGAAVLHGARQALAEGFSFMLCVDADGQHPANMIGEYLSISEKNPDAMVLGNPVFDDAAPRARIHGRKLANFWTDVFTLGSGIGDCLFGMRVYPLEPFVQCMSGTRWARRFDFDPDIVIRLSWLGVRPIKLDTPVRYLSAEEGGVSHFNYVRDNVLLTWMYHRLLPLFLVRLPGLIGRKKRQRLKKLMEDPESLESHRRRRESIASRFRLPWHRNYVSSKLRSDPLYEAVYTELRQTDPDFPLLDIGCGLGLLAIFLRERGLENRIIGYDYDERKIKLAGRTAERYYAGMEFQQGDARETMPEVKGNVTMLDILQFFTANEQEALLRNAAGAVAPGGLLIIRNCLADDSWRFRSTRVLDKLASVIRWMKADPVCYPTENRIRVVLEDEGLEGEFRPLWGRTPFNNWLIVYRRPPQTNEEAGGRVQR